MVFFTCNSCGESLKKNKVDKHLMQCQSRSISCVDCGKDFTYFSFFKINPFLKFYHKLILDMITILTINAFLKTRNMEDLIINQRKTHQKVGQNKRNGFRFAIN